MTQISSFPPQHASLLERLDLCQFLWCKYYPKLIFYVKISLRKVLNAVRWLLNTSQRPSDLGGMRVPCTQEMKEDQGE